MPIRRMAAMAVSPHSSKKPDYAELIVALACGLAITTTVLILAAMPFNRHFASSRDFVVYWATGQQLAHHSNPYDANLMGQMERAGGFDRVGSFYTRNPPWSLPLMLPLGFVGARVAALPWSLLLVCILIVAVRMLWTMFGRRGSHLEWLGYCFPPALQCVIMGQTSLFLLLGLALFLKLHRGRPFWAGAALWLCTLKPHLFVPFGLVLLLWIVVSRSWRVLAGVATAMTASCAAIQIIDPAVWGQYAHWAGSSGIAHEAIPTLGVALRNVMAPQANWLIFVPCAMGSVWALGYFWTRRANWDWLEHGNVLMMVSVPVAPYCWVLDQCVVLPAVLYGACRTHSRAALAALGAIYLMLELQPLCFTAGLNSPWYLWPAPAWLVWYWFARRLAPAESTAALPAAAHAV
jgi:hypothetical protein